MVDENESEDNVTAYAADARLADQAGFESWTAQIVDKLNDRADAARFNSEVAAGARGQAKRQSLPTSSVPAGALRRAFGKLMSAFRIRRNEA